MTYGDGFRNTTLAKQSSAIAQTMEGDFDRRDYSDAVITCATNVADTIADMLNRGQLTAAAATRHRTRPRLSWRESGAAALTDIMTLCGHRSCSGCLLSSSGRWAYVYARPPPAGCWCFGRAPASHVGGPARPGITTGPRRAASMGGGFGGMGPSVAPSRRRSFGRGCFGGGSFGGGFGGMGGGSSHGGGGGRGR